MKKHEVREVDAQSSDYCHDCDGRYAYDDPMHYQPGEPDDRYNGWANHATWQCALFLRGDYGTGWTRMLDAAPEALTSDEALREYVLDMVTPDASRNYGRGDDGVRLYRMDLITNALSDVDWAELRAAMLED